MVQWLRLHLSMKGIQVQSLVGELRFHKPHGKQKQQEQQTNKQSSIVTNSIKTLKIVHIKKNSEKK